INVDRIGIKTLLIAVHTIRRGIHEPADRTLPLILKGKTPSVFFTLADTHYDPCLRENNLRLRDMEISFGKTFDLILQISHLLTILLLPNGKIRYYEL